MDNTDAPGAEQGKGDWTKERQEAPDMTEAEVAAYIERAKADTAARRAAV